MILIRKSNQFNKFNILLRNKVKKLLILFFTLTFIFTGCGDNTSVRTLENRENILNFKSNTQEEILAIINSARSVARNCNDEMGTVGPSLALKWSNILSSSAYEHSRDMALSGIFSHDGSGTEYDITGILYGTKSLFSERISENGHTSHTSTGENIAAGIYSLEEVMDEWLKSPAHCANIMSEDFTNVALSIVLEEESVYGIYWTQDFSGDH